MVDKKIVDLIESLRAEAIQAGGQWGQYYPLTLATAENIMKLLNYITELQGEIQKMDKEKQ